MDNKDNEEVVYLTIFDVKRGDVVFEGKVSAVEASELVWLRCFLERKLNAIYSKATNERVKSFKRLQNNGDLVARIGDYKRFSGVLYVGADDGVLRKSENVPSCECMKMTMWWLSHEECEEVFKCETLEELEINWGGLLHIPNEMGKMKELKKLRLEGLKDLKSIPEEIGELSNLKELEIRHCEIESLPKRLKELKLLKSITLVGLSGLQLNAEDLVVFSKLKRLTIWGCSNVFTRSFMHSFWEMIQSTTDLRVLDLYWDEHDGQVVAAALEENGSIVDGGLDSQSYAQYFKRNKVNHERTMESVLHLLAIRRWRNASNHVPKEMVKMIAMMLWNTKCDVMERRE